MAWVNVPRGWRAVTGQARVRMPGDTLGDVVRELCRQYPPLVGWLDNGQGALPGYLHLFVGEVDANILGGARARLADDAEIHVIVEMSGG
jgi:molybdopterin converting factor small subunit